LDIIVSAGKQTNTGLYNIDVNDMVIFLTKVCQNQGRQNVKNVVEDKLTYVVGIICAS
jgi:membrane protease subunit (stomatin/prohibitin family)